MLMDVLIPALGDIDEVEVIEICASVDDAIEENEGIIVIESDKASMEIPSPAGGIITEICVSLGEMVAEGHLVAKVDVSSDLELEEVPSESAGTEEALSRVGSALPILDKIDILVPDLGEAFQGIVSHLALSLGQSISVGAVIIELETADEKFEVTSEHQGTVVELFVGLGHSVTSGDTLARMELRPLESSSSPLAEPKAEIAIAAPPTSATAYQVSLGGDARSVYAGPAVRRLAREYGVNLIDVVGTGSRGRITKDDLKAYVKVKLNQPKEIGGGLESIAQVQPVDYSKFGETYSLELSRVQQLGAKNLYASWVNLPHVTQHDKVDVTDLEEFRNKLNLEAETPLHKITPLAFIVRACCLVLEEYPMFNSSLEEGHQSILINRFCNIGFAVDTPDGLVVPVIKDADKKGIKQLSSEILDFSQKARENKLGISDLQGGTFTVSSLGALGGTGFTPIVNAPQVAILGVARMATEPVWEGEHFVPRKILPLSLSYDHRVINGADGGRFMISLTRLLRDIRRFSL